MVVFYDLQRHAFETSLLQPETAVVDEADPIICRCLQVRESTIVQAVEEGGARSLCQLACATGAGGGCTACHRRLRQFFSQKRQEADERIIPALAPALQEALDHGEMLCSEPACAAGGCQASSGLLLTRPSAIADSSADRLG